MWQEAARFPALRWAQGRPEYAAQVLTPAQTGQPLVPLSLGIPLSSGTHACANRAARGPGADVALRHAWFPLAAVICHVGQPLWFRRAAPARQRVGEPV